MAEVRYTGAAGRIRIPGGLTLARFVPTTVDDEVARGLVGRAGFRVSFPVVPPVMPSRAAERRPRPVAADPPGDPIQTEAEGETPAASDVPDAAEGESDHG